MKERFYTPGEHPLSDQATAQIEASLTELFSDPEYPELIPIFKVGELIETRPSALALAASEVVFTDYSARQLRPAINKKAGKQKPGQEEQAKTKFSCTQDEILELNLNRYARRLSAMELSNELRIKAADVADAAKELGAVPLPSNEYRPSTLITYRGWYDLDQQEAIRNKALGLVTSAEPAPTEQHIDADFFVGTLSKAGIAPERIHNLRRRKSIPLTVFRNHEGTFLERPRAARIMDIIREEGFKRVHDLTVIED